MLTCRLKVSNNKEALGPREQPPENLPLSAKYPSARICGQYSHRIQRNNALHSPLILDAAREDDKTEGRHVDLATARLPLLNACPPVSARADTSPCGSTHKQCLAFLVRYPTTATLPPPSLIA